MVEYKELSGNVLLEIYWKLYQIDSCYTTWCFTNLLYQTDVAERRVTFKQLKRVIVLGARRNNKTLFIELLLFIIPKISSDLTFLTRSHFGHGTFYGNIPSHKSVRPQFLVPPRLLTYESVLCLTCSQNEEIPKQFNKSHIRLKKWR